MSLPVSSNNNPKPTDMKNILRAAVFAAAFLFAATAPCATTTTKSLQIRSGENEICTFDVAPESYSQKTGRDVVRVDYEKGSTSATFTAIGASGTSKIEFKAPSGAVTIVEVEILDEIDKILPVFRDKAEKLGLKATREFDRILVEGTIGTPDEWARFENLLGRFKGKVDSDVSFKVNKSTIDALRAELVAAGVPLAPEGEEPEEGRIKMVYEGNVLSFSGVVYSAGEIDKLVRVLRTKGWLSLVGEIPHNAATTPKAQAIVSVAVDDSLLELGVAFVVVSKRDARNLESDYNLTLKGVWGGITDFLIGGTHGHQDGKWNDFTINAGLSSSLSMLAENKVSRERQYGTIRFHANGDPGKTLHIGGTVKVMPDAMGDGAAPEAQDFEYGFKIVNKKSRRIGADVAEADIEIEIKGEPFSTTKIKGHNSTVKQETRTVSPTVRVPLGKTVAVAGYESLVEDTIPPSGIPLLRHIPVLSWFTTSRKEELDEYALLFLVSVRRVDVESEAPMVENTAMRDITYDANRPNQERLDEEKEKNKKFHGCWEPLNWFTW